MSHFEWEEISDPRFKYEQIDPEIPFSTPKWSKVWIKDSSEIKCPLGANWKFNYCILSSRYKVYMDLIREMDVSPDDVWVTTYPKSGTTWTQEMVWLIHSDFNFELAKSIPLAWRAPTLREM